LWPSRLFQQTLAILHRSLHALLDDLQSERLEEKIESAELDQTLGVFLIADAGNDYDRNVCKSLSYVPSSSSPLRPGIEISVSTTS
jgi:hypothetical protein